MATIKKTVCAVMALILALAAFAGCNNEPPDTEEPFPEVSAPTEIETPNTADDLFSLNCNKQYSLNPMTTPNADNVLCTQLMYDNIYEVDSTFQTSSRIIKDYRTADGVFWVFTVDTSVEFWDGSSLTAYDVAYSIQRAQQSSRLRGRISGIYGANAMDEDEFAVTLIRANMQFPALLTIPVIKGDSIEESVPLGTGRYIPNTALTRLEINPGHPDADQMPIDVIYLREIVEMDEAIAAYEKSDIDLVANDPTGLLNLGYGSANDLRYYPTTNMHYIGFNSESRFFSRELARRAMTYVVNRERIVNEILGGAAVEAALPMNPASPLYNTGYSDMVSYSLSKSQEAFDEAEVRDFDDDGLREIMITGIPLEIDLLFIVANDSAQKVAAAQTIADNLTDLGITVRLEAMSWASYTAALAEGNFDMFYAETKLTADFYPGELMTLDGKLNFGGFNDSALTGRIEDYMLAGDESRKYAADFMNKYITDIAPIVTICFERHQVFTHRGVVAGMRPSQYNIFHNIGEWTIDLG